MTGEPSGAPESLWGRIQPGAFGDRAHRSKPAELEDRKKKAKEKRKGGLDQDDLDAYAAKRKKGRAASGASVLTAEADGSYRPKTRETRAAYEALRHDPGAVRGPASGRATRRRGGSARGAQGRSIHRPDAEAERGKAARPDVERAVRAVRGDRQTHN